jgi:hypothetical protein
MHDFRVGTSVPLDVLPHTDSDAFNRPPGCIVVMEDIDVGLANGTAIINREEATHGQPTVSPISRITLSGLLNAIVSGFSHESIGQSLTQSLRHRTEWQVLKGGSVSGSLYNRLVLMLNPPHSIHDNVCRLMPFAE